MNIYHKIARKDCLSHQLWPHFKKGWPETDKIVHFFWGLGDGQTDDIRQCIQKKEEWWFVDTGYITEQITRYPSPIIKDPSKTYFRIIKGGLHTIRGKVGNGKRLNKLRSPLRSAESFLIEEIIDPRHTRRIMCEFADLSAPLRKTGITNRTMRP